MTAPNLAGTNLRRLMARQGLTIDGVAARTGLNRRTVFAVLEGGKKPHTRTLTRLAQGLGVSTDELFVAPSEIAGRQFDRQTNPAVTELIAAEPKLFAGWTAAEFDELYSRMGTGGALTRAGAAAAARQMNLRRELQEKLALLLETSHAELVRRMIEVFYEDATRSAMD